MLGGLLGYIGSKMLGSDEGINMGYTGGKVLGTMLGIVYLITVGIDVGTELGSLNVSFDVYNDCNLEI